MCRQRSKTWRWHHDVSREANSLEQADCEPNDVELPPKVTVAGGARIGVMVVVAAFAGREHRDPKIVSASVVRCVIAVTPQMGDRIHAHGTLKYSHAPHDATPDQHACAELIASAVLAPIASAAAQPAPKNPSHETTTIATQL
jgi:hypothetical protein